MEQKYIDAIKGRVHKTLTNPLVYRFATADWEARRRVRAIEEVRGKQYSEEEFEDIVNRIRTNILNHWGEALD